MAIPVKKNVNSIIADGAKKKKQSSTTSRKMKIMRSKLYKSVIGITCHQCRQKTTRRRTFPCKNMKTEDKRCPLQYCENCLRIRYVEEKELEAAQLEKWSCPKCCDRCNCSCCRKRRGEKPTGPLHKKGYKFVSEMLNNDAAVLSSKEEKCVDNSRSDEVLNSGSVSPMKKITSDKELVVLLSGELDKENTSYAKLKEISNENDGACEKKIFKRPGVSEEVTTEGAKGNTDDDTEVLNEVSEEDVELDSNQDNACVPMDGLEASAGNDFDSDVNNFFPNVDMNSEIGKIGKEIPFPIGTDLTEILGIKLPAESVGSALQFLEFCRAFGKVLNLEKGEPKAILQEIVSKQRLRHGQSKLALKFQIDVLTLIQKASGTKYDYSVTAGDGDQSWMKSLEVLINKSDYMKDFPLSWLQEGLHGYHNLDLPKKLTLLNFLCDEALSLEKLRNFIDDQNSRHVQKKKDAKSKVNAAMKKEKELKQNLQNEIAKFLSKEASRPMEEHDALLKKLESDVAKAHAEVLELSETVPKGKKAQAVRIEPEFLDSNGQAFWNFKSVDHALVLQDITANNETDATPVEKWFVYDAEKKDEVDKYISSRAKILKSEKASEKLLKRSM